jgi:hypothetical protein
MGFAMRGNVGDVGWMSVGARHAVPGERTWRGRATCSDVVRGWRVLACGAFGHGMPCPYCRTVQRTMSRLAPSNASCGVFLRWHRRRFHDRLPAGPVLLEVKSAGRRPAVRRTRMRTTAMRKNGYSITTVVWPRAIAVARRPPRSSEGKPNMQWMKRTSWRSTSPPS